MKESILDIPAWMTVTILHGDDLSDDEIKRLAAEVSNAAALDDGYELAMPPGLDFVMGARVYPREFSDGEIDAGAVFDLFEIVDTEDVEA